MNKRLFFISIISLLLIIVTSSIVEAAPQKRLSPSASVNVSPRLTPAGTRLTEAAQKKDQVQSERLEKLRTRAIAEIDRRLKSLTGLTEKINAIKRLTAEQKSALTSSIQEQINSLTSLKTKIQSDSDLETLKADAKSIVDSYRIYLLYIPKIHILTVADAELNYADKLTELAFKLENRLNEKKANGQDVSSWVTLLTQMKSKISEGKSQAQSAFDAVLNLKPEDYPGNKSTLESARQTLQKARQSLQEARRLASQIIGGIKGLKSGVSPTTTPNSSL